MSTIDYQSPVDQLLNYGDCRKLKAWPDYIQGLELTADHIPALIRMATDDELRHANPDSLEYWAPVHAWRALGQLRAAAAIAPLLNLLDDRENDWLISEVPKVLGHIGGGAIPELSHFLADASHNIWARADAAQCLVTISTHYPQERDACIGAITYPLEKFEQNDPTLNGLLISYLIELRAVKAAPLIKRAFASFCVDLFVAGDWSDVQLELSLEAA
ncbi:MAG: HEAT repeat domain-containing protein [Leptolyngbyaceae cyanobacterium MO_188.B28]|nr:HEAT repeat domain-containing protein [Leptolyngbyaceae cyanobacterium MO_188.B28]